MIRPLTEAEYAAWLADVVPGYAGDKVAAGQWREDEALEKSRQEYEALLPQGRDTPDSHLYSIDAADGRHVGVLWLLVKQRGAERIVHVYDLMVWPAHQRQGHAERAMRAAEDEVRRLGLAGIALHVFGHNKAARALYDKLGYEPTNLNLYKPVPPKP